MIQIQANIVLTRKPLHILTTQDKRIYLFYVSSSSLWFLGYFVMVIKSPPIQNGKFLKRDRGNHSEGKIWESKPSFRTTSCVALLARV